jgi:hypothetical protein
MVSTKEFLKAKMVVIKYWSEQAKESGISAKVLEAELYVDTHIKKTTKPPTYRQVAKDLGLQSPSAAFARLRRYRYKMKQL